MTPRNLLALLVLTGAVVLLADRVRQLLADPSVWPPDDFVEYWAAAKLTLAGANPFDEARLLPLQRAAGRDTTEAVMMWNPPWALPLVLPLGALPAREAQLVWLLIHLTVIWFCADRFWLMYGGTRSNRWIGWAVGFVFLPTAFALSTGQISPFLLLGAVLFLECERRGWPVLSGAATVLLAIKPHLAYLVWAALAVDAVARGRWRVLVGGLCAGLVCAALPLLFNPDVWHQYADALGNRPPAQWASPTVGTVLRLAFGEQLFRLQFVSVAAGLLWFAWYRWHKGNDWNWTEQLPLLLLVSFATAPYGAWPFDMVLLLPAVFAMVAGRPARFARRETMSWRFTLIGLVVVNFGCLAMNVLQTGSFWFLWVSPAVLLLSAVHMNCASRVGRPLVPAHEVPA
jgi:hypothetical protein